MSRDTRRLFLLLLLLTSSALPGQTPPAHVTLLGPAALTIPAGQPNAPKTIPIPVRYADPALAGSLLPRVTDVLIDGVSRTDLREAFALTEDPSYASGGLGRLVATVQLPELRRAGVYTVRVEIHRKDTAPPPQTLDLAFTRPAAELKGPAGTLRYQDVRAWWPFFSTLPDSGIDLTETTGVAGVPLGSRRWDGELKGPDGFPLPSRLRLETPRVIEAGGQQRAMLSVGRVPLGTSTGTLTLSSPYLARPVELAVEIRSRLSLVWLFLVLFLGILSGFYLRTRLEKKRLLLEAEAAAQRRLGTLLEIAERTADEALAKDLNAWLAKLRQELDNPSRSDASLSAIVQEVGAAAEARLKKAEDDRKALRERFARLEAMIGSPGRHAPPVRKALSEAGMRLSSQKEALGAGAIESVSKVLGEIEGSLDESLRNAVLRWLSDVEHLLDSLPPFAGTVYEEHRKGLIQDSANLRAALKSPMETGDMLRQEATLAVEIRTALLHAGPRELEDEAGQLANRLRELDDDKVKPLLAVLETRRRELRDWAAQGDNLERMGDLLAPVRALDEALKAALRALAPDDQQDEALKSALSEGRFGEALSRAIALRLEKQNKQPGDGKMVERPLGRQAQQVIAEMDQRAASSHLWRGTFPTPPPPSPGWAFRIEASESPAVDSPVLVRVVPEGLLPANVRIRWYVGSEPSVVRGPGEMAWQFTPRHPGRLILAAEAFVLETGENAMAETVLEIRPAEGFAALPGLVSRLRRVEGLQTLVAGAFITGAGFLIFSPSWIGNFPDLFAALLWGFTVDIGTAKVLEMAAPVLKRPVPLPGVTPGS